MSGTFNTSKLPDVDQQMIKRGLCPWCVTRLIDNGQCDECPDCGDTFIDALTIED